jgi:hypothetical protein
MFLIILIRVKIYSLLENLIEYKEVLFIQVCCALKDCLATFIDPEYLFFLAVTLPKNSEKEIFPECLELKFVK